MKEVFQGSIYHAAASSRAKGVMVGISRKTVILWNLEDRRGQYVILKGILNHIKVILVRVYAPNGNQSSFLAINLLSN